MSEETCTKHNKPFDCMNCKLRESLYANKTILTVECQYGKSNYNIGINSISSLFSIHSMEM